MSYFKAINQGTSSRNDCRNVIRYAQLSTTLWRLNRLYCFTVDAKLIFNLFQKLLISLNKHNWSKFNDIFVWILILVFVIGISLFQKNQYQGITIWASFFIFMEYKSTRFLIQMDIQNDAWFLLVGSVGGISRISFYICLDMYA